jgi:DNA ligase 1
MFTMLFADVAQTVLAVGATRSRLAKSAAIAALLQAAESDHELGVVATWLSGTTPQGRLGVGWSTLYRSGDPRTGTARDCTLTVQDVDTLFTTLAETSGEGSVGTRQNLLADVYSRCISYEGSLLTGLISGELRQGALGGVVLDAIAKAFDVDAALVRRAHLFGGDLATAAVAARRGDDALLTIGLVVGRPVQPMLASTAPDVAAALATFARASVEWKLDGARVQVHRSGDSVHVFTRNLNDITDRLPDVVDIVRALSCDSVVLDGEVLGLDLDGRPLAFQSTISSFATDAPVSSHALQPYFFDCMHLDGVDLFHEPLHKRLEVLQGLVGERQIPGVVTDDLAVALGTQHDALSRGHEGVMVKDAMSTYEAGRRGSTWLKVKPVRTFDLVVLAAEWGHGRRQGWLSNLHLGARRGESGEFVMVGKTFKGLTDKLLTWQTAELLALETRRTSGTVWVRPELVIEIAIDGVQRSSRYPGGVALRFARVKGYRADKSASDADTIESLQALLV